LAFSADHALAVSNEKIKELARTSSTFLTVEMNYGQMVEDVRLSVNGNCPVEFFGYGGGEILTVEEIEEAARKYILS